MTQITYFIDPADVVKHFGSQRKAAVGIGMARTTFQDRIYDGDWLEFSPEEYAEVFGGAELPFRAVKMEDGTCNITMNAPMDCVTYDAELEDIVEHNDFLITEAEIEIADQLQEKQNREEALGELYVESQHSDATEHPYVEMAETLEKVNSEKEILEKHITELKRELRKAQKERLNDKEIREHIYKISQMPFEQADWTIVLPGMEDSFIGVPTLMLSDIHAGEVVDPAQVYHRNAYSIEIMKDRLRQVVTKTVDLLKRHETLTNYPGIVVCLGGDLVSGDIHEELSKTNDRTPMEAVHELVPELIRAIQLLQEEFGRVMVVSVPGNHGRTTKRMPAKDVTLSNYDWHIGCLLEMFFKNSGNDNVLVHNSVQEEYFFNIYNHRYLLTHGHKFTGGDGFIGPLAPVIRGDKKTRLRSLSHEMEYDTLLLGHRHSIHPSPEFIQNGSLIGWNEFARSNNFKYEPPQQMLWLTHPDYGITKYIPVHAEDNIQEWGGYEWVSWVTE